jgi:hypothetical protein
VELEERRQSSGRDLKDDLGFWRKAIRKDRSRNNALAGADSGEMQAVQTR